MSRNKQQINTSQQFDPLLLAIHSMQHIICITSIISFSFSPLFVFHSFIFVASTLSHFISFLPGPPTSTFIFVFIFIPSSYPPQTSLTNPPIIIPPTHSFLALIISVTSQLVRQAHIPFPFIINSPLLSHPRFIIIEQILQRTCQRVLLILWIIATTR